MAELTTAANETVSSRSELLGLQMVKLRQHSKGSHVRGEASMTGTTAARLLTL
jgi:hypothetical protein